MRSLAAASLLVAMGCSGNATTPSGPDMAEPSNVTTYTLAPFTLPAGDEQINCYYVPPDGKDRTIVKFSVDMNPGSHHLIVFRIKHTPGMMASGPLPCTQVDVPSGFDGMLPGSQAPHTEYQLPDGVGMQLDSQHGLYFQSHYINATTKPITSAVTYKITAAPDPSKITTQAGILFYTNMNLDIPPGMSSATKSCKVRQNLTLLTGTGHMHKHGLTFDAALDGSNIYHTDSWDSPLEEVFNPGQAMTAGQTVQWTCDYNNDTSANLIYGNSAATNEMCIFAGVYYPSAAGETQFCF